MSQPSIRVDQLSKRYHIGARRRHDSLREAIVDIAAAPVRRLRRFGRSSHRAQDTIWALRDVSFEVRPGEVVGIIGRNGAGKSTLLKILSRITEPTAGRAELRGRAGSLLEVGTGFHPELTGRENVFLSGAVLGMSRREIKARFDEIVAFSGVETFLDTPIKRYSSGMRVRLGFAVAAHLSPDILLVDEVLAVGDAAFQRKCLGKMSEVSRCGRTVLFVSHNIGSIKSLCGRAMLLRDGRLAARGEAEEVVDRYLSELSAAEGPLESRFERAEQEAPGSAELKLLRVTLHGEAGEPKGAFAADESIHVRCEYRQLAPLSGLRFAVQVRTADGEVAFTGTDHSLRQLRDFAPGRYVTTCVIPGGLLNLRQYVVCVWAGIPDVKYLLRPSEVARFGVIGIGNQGSDFVEKRPWPGVVCPKLRWALEQVGEEGDGLVR
jgi:lipopolysaccharide transport system ATP-binding protein